VATTKSAYDRCVDLKVATPQMIINYATYLEDKGFFEDSFKVWAGCFVCLPVCLDPL
jgi:pre-mRNA-splicing factor SYF1